jgi:hypothetical protein
MLGVFPSSPSPKRGGAAMPYDDEDLFGEDFDFVDDDDDEVAESSADKDAEEEKPAPKSRRRPPPKGKEKPAAERPRSRPKGTTPRRPAPSPPVDDQPPAEEQLPAADLDDEPVDEAAAAEAAPGPTGPAADHAVHIYEFGRLKRTIPRKFTDEEAVGFAEEYTRTGKAYGRYAVATPDDEVPSPTFAGASKGN